VDPDSMTVGSGSVLSKNAGYESVLNQSGSTALLISTVPSLSTGTVTKTQCNINIHKHMNSYQNYTEFFPSNQFINFFRRSKKATTVMSIRNGIIWIHKRNIRSTKTIKYGLKKIWRVWLRSELELYSPSSPILWYLKYERAVEIIFRGQNITKL
jgi:hypothetical protein